MRFALYAAAVILTACVSTGPQPDGESQFTVLSWNVSGDAFVSHPGEFRTLLEFADPRIVLLDEVDPYTTSDQLLFALPAGRSDDERDAAEDVWHISFGSSGGRQRGVIASRDPLEAVEEFAGIVPYPDEARRQIEQRVTAADKNMFVRSMAGGIAVNGAIVRSEGRRLLVVTTDFECCGDPPSSWEEMKRRIEAKEIRKLIRRVLRRTAVDGIVVAGDLNLVSTAIPLVLLTGPYEAPHSALIAAELYHPDGASTWTWDGRGTPFPSRALDFMLYSPNSLRLLRGMILDTERMDPALVDSLGLRPETTAGLSSHRPLVARYGWR